MERMGWSCGIVRAACVLHAACSMRICAGACGYMQMLVGACGCVCVRASAYWYVLVRAGTCGALLGCHIPTPATLFLMSHGAGTCMP